MHGILRALQHDENDRIRTHGQRLVRLGTQVMTIDTGNGITSCLECDDGALDSTVLVDPTLPELSTKFSSPPACSSLKTNIASAWGVPCQFLQDKIGIIGQTKYDSLIGAEESPHG